jgi:branched-chain amino acid transport system permease protein
MTRLLLQSAVSGVLVGGLYGLVALGLALSFGVMKILNVAHGELLMAGGYATFFAFTFWELDPFLSLPLVVVGMFAFGALLYQMPFRYLIRFDTERRIKNSLLISFGLVLILQALATRFFTGDLRTITTSYSSEAFVISLFGTSIRIPWVRAGSLALAVVAAFLLDWLLNRSGFGRAVRATAEDWTRAALTGIDVRRVYLIVFGISASLAGIAGSMIATGYNVSPTIGLTWTLKALIVIVLAGLGSMRGILVAGIILGLTEGLAAVWVGPYREVVALVVFLLVLIFRPQGLFGRGAHA